MDAKDNGWKASEEYAKVVEANRQYYSKVAAQYDATETCVVDARFQTEVEADLDRVVSLLPKESQPITALDACGGSGNIALKLLKRGLDVTITDNSPELLDIFRGKSSALGLKPKIVQAEIGAFLSEKTNAYQLIVFSSALHHLQNYTEILRLAYDRLLSGGILYTAFDPVLRTKMRPASRLLLRAEYYWFKAFCQTSDLPRALSRRLRRIFSGYTAEKKSNAALNAATVGMIAEYHAESGLDDTALAAAMEQTGFELLDHPRLTTTRYRLTGILVTCLGDATMFKLILRKP